MTDADVEETFEYMLGQAHAALREGGSFVPFGAGVYEDGERAHLALDVQGEGRDVGAAIAALVAGLRQETARRAMRAAGLAFDGEITLEGGARTRAVCMHLEAAQGVEGFEAFAPYTRTDEGEILLYDPILAPSTREIFV